MADAVTQTRPWAPAPLIERSSPRPPFAGSVWLAIHLSDPSLLQTVAARCEQFTSWVSLEPPDGVLLEVQGSRRLFGGLHALVEKITQDLKDRSIVARMAVTPTPASALWLSRMEESAVVERMEELPRRLARMPLGFLRWPEEQMKLLDDLGVATVADLLRLPRAGLARRLGREWVQRLDRGLGHCEEPRPRFYAPQRFTAVIEPDDPIETTTRLESLVLSRLGPLQDFLRSRQAAIGSLALRLLYGNHPRTGLRIAPAAPCADMERFAHLLRERLQQLKLPAPVVAVRMQSGPLFAAVPVSASLMQKTDARFRTDPHALPRLVERLRIRLGSQALYGICAVADRRPEKAWAAVNELCAEASAPLPPAFPRRPVWLRFAPELLPGDATTQWTLERGPERIETGWWDGADAARDYFIVRDWRGSRLWVYRERHAPYRWYLQGWFG